MSVTQKRQYEPNQTDEILHKVTKENDQMSIPLLDKAVLMDVPQHWPTSPKRIKTSLYVGTWNLLVDLVLLSFSTVFLIFALVVNDYNGRPTQDHPLALKRLQNAAKYGPTVFPILFASVLGRATHSILIWRLERGERIGTLDILATSTSLTNTVTSQFQLRRFTPLGVGLILLWTLLPIGGQGSIRQIAIGETITSQKQSYEYMSPNGDICRSVKPEGSNKSVGSADIATSYFRAALLSSSTILTSPLDPWGNVKIPWIERYEQDFKSDTEGWFAVGNGSSDMYSSFVGIPISDINSAGFVHYDVNIETTYLSLNCWPLSLIPDEFESIGFPEMATGPEGGKFYWANNGTMRAKTDQEDLAPFEMATEKISPHVPSRCSVTTTYVEVTVECQTYTTCASSKIRRSRLPHPLPAYTQLDSHGGDLWNSTLHGLMTADTYTYVDEVSIMSRFFGPPGNANSRKPLNTTFGQVLNAYWLCPNGYQTIVDGIKEPTTTAMTEDVSWPYQDNRTRSCVGQARTWRTEGTKSVRVEVIKAQKGWVAVLVVASIFLMLASLVPPYVRIYFTKGPDLMMNISSLATWNNPLIPLPANGTFMDASERSRLLRDVKVLFGDMNSTAKTGSLAIGAVNTRGPSEVVRVRRSRLYK